MIVAAKEVSMELGDGCVSDESEILAELLTRVSGDTMFIDGFVELALVNPLAEILETGETKCDEGCDELEPGNLEEEPACEEGEEATGLCFTAVAGLLPLTMLST